MSAFCGARSNMQNNVVRALARVELEEEDIRMYCKHLQMKGLVWLQRTVACYPISVPTTLGEAQHIHRQGFLATPFADLLDHINRAGNWAYHETGVSYASACSRVDHRTQRTLQPLVYCCCEKLPGDTIRPCVRLVRVLGRHVSDQITWQCPRASADVTTSLQAQTPEISTRSTTDCMPMPGPWRLPHPWTTAKCV